MHIRPYDNENKPIVDVGNAKVPLCYFNIVRLKKGETYDYSLDEFESCCVPGHGTCDFVIGDATFEAVGERASIWEGDPSGIYAPRDARVSIKCRSDDAEIFVAGGRTGERLEPFVVRPSDIQTVQYGSDETKTHRKIKHVLGQNPPGKVSRLLISELFTVGAGGWSGFPPHKHDEERPPKETRFEEIYQFRFKPDWGFGAQFITPEGAEIGDVHHLRNGSTILLDGGYHPCVAAPGYEMYYFTILVGESQRSLIQHFHPDHAYQIETIPGIKDMVAAFK